MVQNDFGAIRKSDKVTYATVTEITLKLRCRGTVIASNRGHKGGAPADVMNK
jgi:hypothetical protein